MSHRRRACMWVRRPVDLVKISVAPSRWEGMGRVRNDGIECRHCPPSPRISASCSPPADANWWGVMNLELHTAAPFRRPRRPSLLWKLTWIYWTRTLSVYAAQRTAQFWKVNKEKSAVMLHVDPCLSDQMLTHSLHLSRRTEALQQEWVQTASWHF